MTICISAICADATGEAGRAVVIASDRMVTFGGLTEFEHDNGKITDMGPLAACLMAGDALRGSTLTRAVAGACAGTMAVPQIAELVAERYVADRLKAVEAEFLRVRGLTMDTFLQGHQQLLGPIVGGIDQQIAAYDFGLQILVAGVDDEGGHVFQIGNPGGTAQDLRPIGSGAIGSGSLHAIQSMISFRHSPRRGLNETIFRVFASKRAAEVAPGVGRDTDVVVITSEGKIALKEQHLEKLNMMHEQFREPAERQLSEEIASLWPMAADSAPASGG